MDSPFANILHRDAMKHLVDARTFQRGERYFADRRVSDLVRRASTLSAIVRGTTSYRVRLWVKDASLAYSCNCPIGEEGAFCKHGVAVGLAWVALEGGAAIPAIPTSAAGIRAELEALDRKELIDLLAQEIARDPRLGERVARRLGGRAPKRD